MTTGLPDNAFRANVGAVIINRNGLVLAFARIGIKGAWQFPQGGLLEGEEPLEAIYREIKEETNIERFNLTLLQECSSWLVYELPKDKRTNKHGRGQAQKWFLFLFSGQGSDINLDGVEEREFSQWKWTRFDDLINETVEFRKDIYRRLAVEFAEKIDAISTKGA